MDIEMADVGLPAVQQSRIGEGFINEIPLVRDKSVTVLVQDAHLNAIGTSGPVRQIRAKFGEQVVSCEQGEKLMLQVENELARYNSIQTQAKNKKQRSTNAEYIAALEEQKSRIANAMVRLGCEKLKVEIESQAFTQQLFSATQSAEPEGQQKSKVILYVGLGVAVVVLGTIIYVATKK